MELKFKNEHLNYHHEQDDYRLYALDGGNTVGYVDYSTFRNEVNVSFIKSYVVRQRVGTAMLMELQSRFPKTTIKFGFTTDEGNLLLQSLNWKVEVNPFYDTLQRIRTRLQTRLEEIKFHWGRLETLSEPERSEVINQIENLRWNDTEDALEKVELRLSREPEFFNYIDAGPELHNAPPPKPF